MPPAFRFIDLFAGIGGFHHALSAPEFAGECVLAVESDPKCQQVYAATWPQMAAEGRITGDIRAITRTGTGGDRPLEQVDELVPDHEVLCAGFPCQPFSKSGAQQGVADSTRGTLFFDILRIIEAKAPKFLILENVRNLAGPRHAHTWATIVASLRAQGYRVSDQPVVISPHRLSPDDGGAPQSRERVFILGTRVDEPGADLGQAPLVASTLSPGWDPHSCHIEDYLLDESDVPNAERYRLRPQEVTWLDAWQDFIAGISDDMLPGFPIWVDAFTPVPVIPEGTPVWKKAILEKNSAFYSRHRTFIDTWLTRHQVADFPASRRKLEWQARSAQPTRASRNLWELTIHLRPSGVRVKPATYLPALVAITQTSIIGSRRRRITPVEAGRLQGLPDGVFGSGVVDDATAYRQAGNAVNTGVVTHVSRALFASAGLDWGQVVGPQSAAA